MFKKTVASFILLGVCSTPLMALAQHDDNHHDNNNNDHQNDSHQNDHHDAYHQNYVHHNEWKHGYHMSHQDWSRGQRVDYHAYHLSAPPRGYEWREVDGNYVMAAVATGVIASVIVASAAH